MPTLNYTTNVPTGRTVGEVQALLARAGAATVATQYDAGQPAGVSFILRTPHGDRAFVLPVDVAAVHRLLAEQEQAGQFRRAGKARGTYSSREQAARVAWRVAKDWLEAQLAIIEARLATLDQVMLPYLIVEGDRTLYQLYREREQAALPPGEST